MFSICVAVIVCNIITSTDIYPGFEAGTSRIARQQIIDYMEINSDDIAVEEPELKLNKGDLVILLYTTIFFTRIWHGLQGKKLHSHYRDMGCPKCNCHLTYNKSNILIADAVIFHARDVEGHRKDKYSAKRLALVRRACPREQIWIFLSHENPQHDSSIYAPYRQLFNWTSTFNRKSDVVIPYGTFIKKSSNEPLKNYAKEKTGAVAWAASNCLQMRLQYVQELQYYIDVTVYGKCNSYFAKRKNCEHFSEACTKEISKYKFFLAFENDFCEDYVTEKYWERIYQEAVPVVMGGNYEGIAIPRSYIDVSDFSSIKALADYLLYLDSNDTAYNSYFAWKSDYAINAGPLVDLHCSICMALNSKKAKEEKIMTLHETFNRYSKCDKPFKLKRESFLKQIQESKKTRQGR